MGLRPTKNPDRQGQERLKAVFTLVRRLGVAKQVLLKLKAGPDFRPPEQWPVCIQDHQEGRICITARPMRTSSA